MNTPTKFIVLTLIYLLGPSLIGQDRLPNTYEEQTLFTIRGSVYDKASFRPYSNVKIFVNGTRYTTSKFDGSFTIRANIGDELIISHDDFETIYYKIKTNERISIEVITENPRSSRDKAFIESVEKFNKMIDSADTYLRKDEQKSIQFIAEALNEDITASQSATAHELLGDIYVYWEQYDLAITAYRISIQNSEIPITFIKLGRAYLNDSAIEKCISTLNRLQLHTLSNYEKVLYFETLGDARSQEKNFAAAVLEYQKGLAVAEKHKILSKETDLNSKIAQAYNKQGKIREAKDYFSNSLNLAKKENKKRAVEEQIKVAEFNGDMQDYEGEIELRKQAIESLEDIERDSVIPNESSITTQKQNYKIGNAYSLNNDFDTAIPYYKKSIEAATKKKDLVVKKDATRKLSEALISKGETEEGLIVLSEYKDVVDELYAKREQEISQIARFSRNIAEQQNRIASLESDRRLSLSKYELTQERNKRQQLIIYSLLSGLVLLLIAGYFMYKYIKQQRLANNLLALKSLRSQMNPHFIFNALNSVNSFIATNDERTANKYLSDFSQLMRSVLENSEEDFIPLKKEIHLIELYTKLEHFRFQDKFDYSIEVDETIDTEDFQIPPMLLQPYIENAVWHGLRYKTEKGHLNIAVRTKSKDEITITISDDGIGRIRSKDLKTSNQLLQKSKGMNNIKRRVAILNEMYKDKVDVTVEDYSEDIDVGTQVIITLKKD